MAARELTGGQAGGQPHRCQCGGQAAAPVPRWGPPSARAPRGWYRNPDRASTAQLRFWDGGQWTDQTRALMLTRVEHKPPGDKFTNAALTVLTMGLWAPVWMVRAGPRYRIRQ